MPYLILTSWYYFMFAGSMVALVTPMLTSGEIDFVRLAELVEFHIDQGTDAIVSVGTTGESATLSKQEHLDIIKATLDYTNKRIPVIAGTGANSTTEAIELTSEAYRLGVDACLLVVPYYNKPTQKGLYQHFSAIANKVAVPQILYNVPSRTVVDMLPETVIELSKIDNIIGIKEATGDISRVATLQQGAAGDFALITGEDPSYYEFLEAGGQGIISVTANVAPKLMHTMWQAVQDNDTQLAQNINDRLMPLHKKLFIETSPIPVKHALYVMDKIDAGIRLPLTWLDNAYQQPLEQCLVDCGIVS